MGDLARIDTYNEELLILSDYAAFVREDFPEDEDLRADVNAAFEPMTEDDALTIVCNDGYRAGFYSHVDVPGELVARLGGTVTGRGAAVNFDHNCESEPSWVEGTREITDEDDDTSEQMFVLIWFDTGYFSPHSAPDHCVVVDSEYEATVLISAMSEREQVACQSCDYAAEKGSWSTGWAHPEDGSDIESPATFATGQGACCPRCGGQLWAGMYMGDANTMQDALIPHDRDAFDEREDA